MREATTNQVFSAKHYAWLANWIKELDKSTNDAKYIAQHLANAIGAQHPRFDRVKFLREAGIETVTVLI